ncbi:MAG: hypothetical protein J6J18_06595 [Oscillospiraceae bacterium]|nr:hypothetical protein [Oscillospiraceae bacterium]
MVRKIFSVILSVCIGFVCLTAALIDMVNGGHSWESGSPEAAFIQEAYGALSLYKKVSISTCCTDEEAQLIWDTLMDIIGNPYGAAGAMGNMYHESGLAADRLQGDIPYSSYSKTYTAKVDQGEISREDFIYHGPNGGGYGLAQWTWWSYKRDLYDLAQSRGTSIGDLETNLELLRQKLNGEKRGVLTALQNATSVREASDIFLHQFERPADQSEAAEERRANTSQTFYSQYALGISSGYISDSLKTNLGLVEWAYMAYNDGWGYVWGTYGHVLTDGLLASKINQYPDNVGIYEDFIRQNYVGKRTADCIGLIKGYSWYNPETGSIEYATNGMPDISAGQIYSYAKKKGPISTLPEIPGLVLCAPGHVGIYVGGGYVIHASGTKVGVIKTQVASGGWTSWCENPYILYVETGD